MRTSGVRGGFTIAELMVSAGIITILSGALFSGAMVLQKSYVAIDDYSVGKADETRLSDYLAMDLRRALTVVQAGTTITIQIPDFYDSAGVRRTPQIIDHQVYYNSTDATNTVVYTQRQTSIYRQENSQPEVEIAANVEDFRIILQDLNKVVNTSITFQPRFQAAASTASRASSVVSNTTLLRNKRRDRP